VRLTPGTRLGPYQIVDHLGAGGMGEVYRATDSRLGRSVAVKVLGESLVDHPSAAARFEREARAVAALSHPNILAIYEFDIEGDIPIVVTELLEGQTLRERLGAGAISWRKAVEIAASVADGLAAAHTRGVIHRDLKPANIFLTNDGLVKILDFGIAQFHEPPADAGVDTSVHTAVAETHRALGTVGYASPEQLIGRPPAPGTDIFALGVVLYEMIAGRNPFTRATGPETMAAVLGHEPPPLPHLDRIVQHCLEKNPEQRFQSARDLARALRDSLGEPAPHASPKRGIVATAAAALLAIAAAAYVAVSQTGRKAETGGVTSLAILPLANATNDRSLDYLAEGLTEGLINQISELVPSTRVTAQSTVFRYRNKPVDPIQVGRDLGVRALMTGKVEFRGDQVLVQAHLIDAKDGAQLWGDRFTRTRVDLVSLPGEMAGAMATRLRPKTSPGTPRRSTAASAVNPAAYDLYLKGLHILREEDPKTRPEAIAYFQQAIEVDPQFARPYAALAETYIRAAIQTEPALMHSKAKEAVSRALAADPDLPEAHAALGSIYMDEWNLPAAEREFKRALQRNGSLAPAHSGYSLMLRYSGRFSEAIVHAQRAKELDPLSRRSSIALAATYLYAGQNDKADAELKRLLRISPNYAAAHYLLGRVYSQQGRTAEACGEFTRYTELAEGDPRNLSASRQACRSAGSSSGLRDYYLQQIRFKTADTTPGRAYEVAFFHAALGEDEKMYEFLESAYRERSTALILINADPIFERVRQQPRFQDLLRRVGFAQTPRAAASGSTAAASR
jgi:eukaryotic-like serine/threonine-protein kinase